MYKHEINVCTNMKQLKISTPLHGIVLGLILLSLFESFPGLFLLLFSLLEPGLLLPSGPLTGIIAPLPVRSIHCPRGPALLRRLDFIA